ncbi:helix-turn-helix transcriptional regulator [Marinobacter sp. F4216]|uniref:helix-turn-helix transcriptional regulator n=1 Tax=Marinobacter sp. F4216 TaxID=2874281 RepID=UPI001CBE6DCB|nr:AlpA family phage regulatory protein [Marinobacter sp. F4216]MBZ2168910.1 AlpA family phage regulatory protein [Marinobacter sp. F4216]
MSDQHFSILRLPETLRRTGLSRTKLYELQAAGEFPGSVKLSQHGNGVGWIESEVTRWVQGRISERDCRL